MRKKAILYNRVPQPLERIPVLEFEQNLTRTKTVCWPESISDITVTQRTIMIITETYNFEIYFYRDLNLRKGWEPLLHTTPVSVHITTEKNVRQK